VIISEKSKDPYGHYLELLGNYNPRTKALNVKADRIKYWISKGAQTSASVNNLLINAKIIEGKKMKVVKISDTRKEKIAKAKGEKKKEAAHAPKAEEPKVEAVPEVKAEETKLEEVKTEPSTEEKAVD
jgi:small subunit ribosomal protein S16